MLSSDFASSEMGEPWGPAGASPQSSGSLPCGLKTQGHTGARQRHWLPQSENRASNPRFMCGVSMRGSEHGDSGSPAASLRTASLLGPCAIPVLVESGK